MSIRSFSLCSRPQISQALRSGSKDLGAWNSDSQLPVVYSERYNFTFWGVEKLHPFDSCKFRTVVNKLESEGWLCIGQCVEPVEAKQEVLLDVHTKKYLRKIGRNKCYVVQVVELPPLLLAPNFLVQRRLMVPMRHHVAGTMMAALMAVEKGWAINIGGGMHHASHNQGMGWCFYSDIYLGARRVRQVTDGEVQKILVIDLDVHQGNGIARDKQHFEDKDMYILDMYNMEIFPGDSVAVKAVDEKVTFRCGERGEDYQRKLVQALGKVQENFQPDMIFFNAGTDVLVGDPLGLVRLSGEDVVRRDETVFQFALDLGVPICMVLSGGYTKESPNVIAKSIANLMGKFSLVEAPEKSCPC